jgi:hypothetical protein
MVAHLTYWNGQGNAEIIRLMMAACGEPWEDTVPLDSTSASCNESHTTAPLPISLSVRCN